MGEQVNVKKGNTKKKGRYSFKSGYSKGGEKEKAQLGFTSFKFKDFTTNQLTFLLSIYVEKMLSNFSFEYS